MFHSWSELFPVVLRAKKSENLPPRREKGFRFRSDMNVTFLPLSFHDDEQQIDDVDIRMVQDGHDRILFFPIQRYASFAVFANKFLKKFKFMTIRKRAEAPCRRFSPREGVGLTICNRRMPPLLFSLRRGKSFRPAAGLRRAREPPSAPYIKRYSGFFAFRGYKS